MADNFSQELTSIRRHIHKFPELSGEESRTAAFIKGVLRKHGIASVKTVKNGVVGIIKGPGKSKKCIALRCDIDALPIDEKTGKPYASRVKGVMHACGHDANTTMVLGSAILLSKAKSRLKGAVKFIFQPSEELGDGAASMIKAQALKKPEVGVIVGIHVNPWLKSGVLGLKYGQMMAAVDRFELEITGDGGHGAYPHLGKDAVVIASQVVNCLQNIVSREIDPTEPAVITVGTISGGTRYNVLCGLVKMQGTVRTLSEKLHRAMPHLIEKKVRNITRAYGASYKLNYEVQGYTLTNSSKVLDSVKKTAASVFGKNKVKILDRPSMGGEDFAEYLRYVPGCFLYLGTAVGREYPWHHQKFDVDEKALPKGARLLSEIVKKYLK